jgi:hypothetical protein
VISAKNLQKIVNLPPQEAKWPQVTLVRCQKSGSLVAEMAHESL